MGIKRELSGVFLHKQHPNTQILIIQGLGYVNGQGANNRWDVRRDGALFPARLLVLSSNPTKRQPSTGMKEVSYISCGIGLGTAGLL